MSKNMAFGIGITAVSLAVLIPILVMALRTSGSPKSGVGFGAVLSSVPGLHLVGELKCDTARRHCSGVVANDSGQVVQDLRVVIGWKGVGPQTVRLGRAGPEQESPFSVDLPSAPDDIRDYSIAFTDG